MNINTRSRFIIFGVIILGLFILLFVQLIQLTLVKGDEYAAMSEELKTREIRVSGARGSIFDRNGLPLAYDQKSYNVQFKKNQNRNSEVDRAYYTGIIIESIDIIEHNGGKTIDSFAIRYDSDIGEYYFDWDVTDPKARALREANWRDNMFVDDELPVEDIYLYLRRKYQIPSEVGYEDARKVLSVWQDVQLARWVAYKPIDIAYNVSIQTVAEIETHRAELEGMSIADSTVRIYPRQAVAAHTIGYLGRITDPDALADFSDLGYSVDDLVGVSGIEASMEAFLSGNSAARQGKKVVEIDNMAVVVNELSATEPTQGDNVMLTIDIPLQLALEESLATNVPRIKADQLERYEENEDGVYDDIEDIDKVDLAESAAAVAIDVNTGEVLAIGSYPSFDLNLFTGGIEYDVYEELKADTATPLFNKAVSSRGTPGSIFKMVTGLGGLMEGELTLSEEIDDEGPYDVDVLYGRAPRCWTKYPRNHQDQTIVEGLKNSCNYFFFTVADRLGIDRLVKWGDKFGLTSSTGIEIPGEAIGQVGNQSVLYDNTKAVNDQRASIAIIVKRSIIKRLKEIGEIREVSYDDDLLDDTAEELVYLAGMEWTPDPLDNNILKDERGVTLGDHVRSILSDNLQISETISRVNLWDRDITSFLYELRWSPFMTVTSGIGQGIVLVTPIAVARYVAALVNGGIVYETHVVDKIIDQDGTVIFDKQPVVYDTLGAPDAYLEAIKQGMADVVSDEDGTATKYFKDFEYQNEVGGKTGTAEVSKIDLENNSWFVCFAPYIEPEIAVVVYTPHGFSGGLSTLVAQDIVAFYLDRKKIVAKQTIPDGDSLVY